MVGSVRPRPLILIAAPDGLHPAFARLTADPRYETLVVRTGPPPFGAQGPGHRSPPALPRRAATRLQPAHTGAATAVAQSGAPPRPGTARRKTELHVQRTACPLRRRDSGHPSRTGEAGARHPPARRRHPADPHRPALGRRHVGPVPPGTGAAPSRGAQQHRRRLGRRADGPTTSRPSGRPNSARSERRLFTSTWPDAGASMGWTVTRATATDRRPTPANPTTQEAVRQPHACRVPRRRAPRTASSSAGGPPRSSERSDPGWPTGDERSEHVGFRGQLACTQGGRTRPPTPPTSGSRTSRHETSIRNPGPRRIPASGPPAQARAAVLPAHRASRPPPALRTVESSIHPGSAAARCAPWPAAELLWSSRPLAGRLSGTTSSHPDRSGKSGREQLLSLPRPDHLFVVSARAFVRMLRGRNGWAKTRRNAEPVTAGPVALES